jgi:hypothetical protein
MIENVLEDKNGSQRMDTELTQRIEPDTNHSFRRVFARDMAASAGRADRLREDVIIDLENNIVQIPIVSRRGGHSPTDEALGGQNLELRIS